MGVVVTDIDSTLLGETAAKCMDSVSEMHWAGEGKIIACGIVVVVESEDESQTYMRTFCSERIHHHQVGLFRAGLMTIEEGFQPDEGEDE